MNVEHPMHPHQLKERANCSRHRAQTKVASPGIGLTQAGNQRPESGAVNKLHPRHIKNDAGMFMHEGLRCIAEFSDITGIEIVFEQFKDQDVLTFNSSV